jgi:valyl-tRNA synthetase
LNENGAQYAGLDRFDVRKQIEKDLETAGLLEKTEPYTNKIGCSERTDAVIEPKLSMQWFLKMEQLAKPALEAVMNDDIQLYPAKFKNTYRHWMENVKDWCISRQLWWGHRIPAYFLPQGGIVVALSKEEAYEKALAIVNYPLSIDDLRQDEDCLDTWFSSWLWPISVFDGINNPENEEIKYYYPTNDLVTGPDILFFWVARMIIAGYEYKAEMPFKRVYLTGIVRDKIGRKMSKTLGNSPDPLDLIEEFGADAVRLGMLLTAPAGNDLPYDDSLCEQGRNFNNKIWNAFRLVKGWEVADIEQPESARMAVKWFDAQLNKTLIEIDDLFSKYRLSEALMAVYKLFWDEFSSWYLEMAKPAYQKPIDRTTYESTLGFFDSLLKVLHPFMPFITEELWQALEERKAGESIMVVMQPKATHVDEKLITEFEYAKEIIAGLRTVRLQKNIPNKESLNLQIAGEHKADFDAVVLKLGNLETIESVTEKAAASISFLVGTTEFSIPMGNLINAEEEIAKMEAEIIYFEGFIESVMKKLGNERFVANAKPEVVEAERKKKADAESKIASLKEGIIALK